MLSLGLPATYSEPRARSAAVACSQLATSFTATGNATRAAEILHAFRGLGVDGFSKALWINLVPSRPVRARWSVPGSSRLLS